MGANGYLGKHLVHYLSTQPGYETVCFGLATTPYTSDHEYHSLDVTRRESFAGMDLNVGTIYFLSGLTGTIDSVDNYHRYIDTNENGLLNLLDEMRVQGSRAKIIYPSTRLVYKGKEKTPLTEDSEKEFKTVYASSKYNGEQYLAMHRNYFGLDFTVFRICVPYGNLFDKSFSYGTTGFFIRQASQGQDISLYGDGKLRRTFSYVEDICQQIVRAGQAAGSAGQVYNVAGKTYSLAEVAQLIATRYGVGIRYVDWPELALKSESGDTIFDSTKIEKLLGETTTTTLEDWFDRFEISA